MARVEDWGEDSLATKGALNTGYGIEHGSNDGISSELRR